MKKSKTILALGLCVALGLCGGGLVACNKDKDPEPTHVAGDNSSYWLAGKIKGVAAWDPPKGEDGAETEPADAVRFKYTDEADIYTVTLDLWQDDMFKIRYVGRGWDDEGGQLNASNNFDEATNGDTENGISGEPGTGMGGRNFQVYAEGNYTVTINATGDVPDVTWVRNGDAEDKAPIKVSGITVKKGETAITSLTLRMGETAQLTAEVLPENATDKAVEWKVTPGGAEFFTCVNGLVTPIKVGSGKLQVKAGGKTVEVTVTVVAADAEIVDVESVTIPAAQKTHTKHVGEKITVEPEVLPANATDKTVTYSVPTGSKVVNIEDGVITAASGGTVVVTATAGDKTDTFTVTVVNDYCLAGSSPSPAFGGTSWKGDYKSVTDVPQGILFTQDAQDATKYTLDIDLYAGSDFKIINVVGTGATWWGAGAGTKLVNSATEDTAIASGDQNIGVTDDGKYRLTLTVPAEGTPTLSYKYLGAAEVLSITTDIRIKGDYDGWATTTLLKAGLSEQDGLNATFKIKVTGEGSKAFGLYTAATGEVSQLNWARNDVTLNIGAGVTGITDGEGNWMLSAGCYEFTVTVTKSGAFTAVAVANAEDETGAVEIVIAAATPEA